jgi:excinuclease ABC subunit A
VAKEITVKGAREHNLKNVSVTIPRNKLVVFTGLSGSGKSSLAFDTIYAEGQRRYLESLSAYARQFMEQMRKPDVDGIDGLSPSISIEQKNISRNPRSTVGTVTEIYDYLRLLYARVGAPHCYNCGSPIQTQTVAQITEQVMGLPTGTRFSVLAPVIRGKKGEYQRELADFRSKGFVRARVDGAEVSLAEPIKLKKTFKHDISIYIDRLILKPGIEGRLAEALETASMMAEGLTEIENSADNTLKLYSTKFACVQCGSSFAEIEPRGFSFNNPQGACPDCNGLGTLPTFDPDLIVPDPTLSLREGAIAAWSDKTRGWQEKIFDTLAKRYKFELSTPWDQLPEKVQQIILYGSGSEELEFGAATRSGFHAFTQPFEGVVPSLEVRLKKGATRFDEEELALYLSYKDCPVCKGARLKPESLAVMIGGRNISEVAGLPIDECFQFMSKIKLLPHQEMIAEPIFKEILARLGFLENVGLAYLTLSRTAATLSGGEAQRIRLGTQIGSSLVGVLYVLDEPSIGLHQRDNEKLIHTLLALRDQGNSVIVVEHDQDTIEAADFVVDLGPGAGKLGGEIVFQGTPAELVKSTTSLTGQYINGTATVPVPQNRRAVQPERQLHIVGAAKNNLKNIDVAIPLGLFVGVTGVSGSGKSTFVIDTLMVGLQAMLSRRPMPPSLAKSLKGVELLDKVVYVDQSPIGRSPRSNPATYTGLFTDIRTLFSSLPESRARGYSLSRFSFNVPGGRCEACTGEGTLSVTMHFLPDVYVECEVCRGQRYNRETLEVLYRGKSIADVLNMSIEEAATFFERVPNLRMKFQTLRDVGLGYVHVGQSATTLSGGEAQRIKLARELNRRATGRTMYILDEPTTGLHFDDVKKLVHILQSLVDQGNSVLVIEHNLDVIKQADWVIDLGPDGGGQGGHLVFEGTPEGLAKNKVSETARFLRKLLPS